ncbi:hypothetical protein BCL57_003295 [Agromyces flavus]|uniref:Putative zinc-finger n=1 Tax=Agromyces flavus TaxID=589382 RepID=A0A1H1NDH1_9MICO|nr:zf-HC2 domain-containing protein [Agromyces flavus]MCP2369112.1 hypothetical protein [Agromyces flavus]GGI48592.1 anti-sigma factor [Agromyces flavus]SDR97003.1 Putative zinc-finger [Agromyces flavus]
MKPDHSRYADWDSAYVLGALAPGERRDYEAHLETCEACRRSVGELAPMPGLLARLAADRAEALLDETAVGAPAPRPELLDAVRREGGRRRRRTRVRFALAAAAAVVVIAAVAIPLALMRPAAAGETVAFRSLSDRPVSASAVLSPVDWGTRIELDCTYDAEPGDEGDGAGWPYSLVVVGKDGERSEVSSWRASPGATARLEAGTALAVDEIVSLEIRAVGSGDVLLRADVG